MVNTEKDRGGAARMAATLVDSINHGHADISAVLAHCGDAEKNDHFKGYKRNLIYYLNVLQTRLLGSHRIYDFGISSRFYELAKQADVIHLHNLHGYYLDFVKFVDSIRDKPIVWTWHDMWGATGRCGFSMDCELWLHGCPKCPHLDYYPKVWVDNAGSEFKAKRELFLNLPNLSIVSPSEWLRDIAVQAGFDNDKAYAMPNPVDLTRYKPVEQKAARDYFSLPDQHLLLFVAHDCSDERKRYKDFEKVCELSGVKGVVVGVPPAVKHPDMVYLGKLKSSEELAKAYSAADAFVITSQSDNYPNTVIESMACGTPVFGYAIGGIPSQMPEVWDGLVAYKDIQKLSEKIKNYLGDSSRYKNVSELVIEHSNKNWDPRVVSANYIDLYRRILDVN